MAHLLLSGASGDYASAPEQNLVDVDARFWIEPDDWSVQQMVVGQWSASNTTRTFGVVLGQGALPRVAVWTGDGASAAFTNMLTNHSFTNGVGRWVRATLDVNDGGGNRVLRVETSTESETLEPTAVTWTLVEERTVAATVTIQTASTLDWHFGGDPNSNNYWYAGKMKRVWVADTIGGSPVSDPDFSDPTTWTYA